MKLSLPEHFRQMSGLHSCIYGMQQAVMWQCWRTVRKRTPSGMAAVDGQLRSIDSRLLLLLLGGEPAGTTGMALLGGKAGEPDGDGIVSQDVAAADTVSDKVLLVHKHRDR